MHEDDASTALGRRGLVAALLATLAAVLIALGGILVYVGREVGDPNEFAGRMVSSLDVPAVRQVVADQTADAVVSRANADLLAVRPLIATVVESVVQTRPFQRAVAFGLADTHRALVTGNGSLIVQVEGTGRQLIAALRSVSPVIAGRTSGDPRPVLTRINPDNAALRIVRKALDWSEWGWWLLGAGVLAALGAVGVAVDRRRATGHVGAALVVAGAVMAVAVQIGGVLVKDIISRKTGLHADDDRAALAAVWSALFGDLRTAGLYLAVGGVVIAAVSGGLAAPLRRVGDLARRTTTMPPWLWRGGLVVAGVACLLVPGAVLRILVLALGAALLYAGLRDVAARIAVRPAVAGPRRRDGLLAGVVLGVVVLAAGAAGAVALRAPDVPAAPPPAPREGCNGSRRACDLRVDQVLWPATHNSYAAADQPGWLFPNQTRPIARQLQDGIRGLTLDVHWGVKDPGSDLVRTDLQAEGMTRNKVAAQIGPQGVRAAERLAGGRLGTQRLTGKREVYLCHTLCELGAEPIDPELRIIRRFLDEHPEDVLTVVFEPYVPPAEIEAALRRTNLLSEAPAFDRTAPLPTLRQLIDADTRFVVFAEEDGGTYPWYMPAFSYIQDTPLGARTPSQLQCTRFRGDADSPILLINHWIDRFPPRVSDNARINRKAFLDGRIDRCTQERGLAPGLVAVDFYERGALLEIAAERNG